MSLAVTSLYEKDGVTYCRFEMGLKGWREDHQRLIRLEGVLENVSAESVAGKSLCRLNTS
jgi:hypothetical protein